MMRQKSLSAVTPSMLEQLEAEFTKPTPKSSGATWRKEARKNQLPPKGAWDIWLILAGRGWGKTRAAAEWAADKARNYPGARIALIASTFADARDTMVEGESGLLAVLDDGELRGGTHDRSWNRSLGELHMANGSQFKIYSSEAPSKLRGPQHHFAWADEAAHWVDAHKGTARDTTWSNLRIGLRLKGQSGWPAYRPQVVVATTPRPVALLKVPDSIVKKEPSRAGILQIAGTHLTTGKTEENLDNLSESYRDSIVAPLQGTTLGKQELGGQLLEDFEGALITRDTIDQARVPLAYAKEQIGHVIVAVDPAVTDSESSDETGIIVIGHGWDGDLYVIADLSLKAAPSEWAHVVWHAVEKYGCQTIVVETNQGGDLVTANLHATYDEHQQLRNNFAAGSAFYRPPPAPMIKKVHAAKSKWVRALAFQPVYEQGKIHHVEPDDDNANLAMLEEQLVTWTGRRSEKSPDRVDALIHGLTFLYRPKRHESNRTTRHRWSHIRR